MFPHFTYLLRKFGSPIGLVQLLYVVSQGVDFALVGSTASMNLYRPWTLQ